MFKKILVALSACVLSVGFAFAAVEVNKADQVALDGIKGIGPATSKAIIAARSKGGDFKNWADFESRVKGVGAKSASKLSDAGLTVNGQPMIAATEKMPATEKAGTKVEKKIK
jgi:competence protein ComEA